MRKKYAGNSKLTTTERGLVRAEGKLTGGLRGLEQPGRDAGTCPLRPAVFILCQEEPSGPTETLRPGTLGRRGRLRWQASLSLSLYGFDWFLCNISHKEMVLNLKKKLSKASPISNKEFVLWVRKEPGKNKVSGRRVRQCEGK